MPFLPASLPSDEMLCTLSVCQGKIKIPKKIDIK